jgi:hypothetical protein
MTQDEYNTLFHKEQLNLVAFKRLMDCDEEVLRLVNKAIEAEHKVMQAKIETLYAMYELAVKQRDYLMDQQSAQVEAMRGRVQ